MAYTASRAYEDVPDEIAELHAELTRERALREQVQAGLAVALDAYEGQCAMAPEPEVLQLRDLLGPAT